MKLAAQYADPSLNVLTFKMGESNRISPINTLEEPEARKEGQKKTDLSVRL